MTATTWVKETAAVSCAYIASIFVTFEILMPTQNAFFPEFTSRASLLFLPHGVRVLAAWLLGWRSVPALAPGVFIAFVYVAGSGAFAPSRLAAMLIAITVPAAIFHVLKRMGWDLFPQADRMPCWPCIMVAGVIISLLTATLTNIAFGSPPLNYFAYLIGDVFGLFFLMLILMLTFRALRGRNA